ncbi:MAG: purine-binding chemotaxis protein CheW [Candidatus Aureabacteria bacterium]|nr:purine-binding chemotaxis protein CheW [Candidatus Auribacterota bacterium]
MTASEKEISLVTFMLGKETFGVPIHQIKEIIRVREIIRVPNTPPFMEGIINLRGLVVCVMDLRKRFHIEQPEVSRFNRILIVEIKDRTVGMMVDKASEVVHLQETSIEPLPPEMKSMDTRFMKGVGKTSERFILILDVEKMFSTEELLKLEDKVFT